VPKELPSAKDLWEGAVAFFSIDTDLIQSAGYDLSAGALNQLPAQLPMAMKLKLSEVVVQEIIKHRMEPVLKAIGQFKSASDALKRTAGLGMTKIDSSFSDLSAENVAIVRFRKLIEEYVVRCRGDILPIDGEGLAAKVFAQYFSGGPPFALRADKKSEFPDATTLILLEAYAKENNTKGIFASGDGGCASFAAQSEHLYCVKSIEDLATLFASTGEHAQATKLRVIDAISDKKSSLHTELRTAIHEHIVNAFWSVDDIYSGVVSRVEGEVADARLKSYEISTDQAEIWEAEDGSGSWIVELAAKAEVGVLVDVTFFVWDSIDREELALDTQQFEFPAEVEINAFLNCSGINTENPSDEWVVNIDIASGEYEVNVGEVDPDFDNDD
jgi:hypothetical protein